MKATDEQIAFLEFERDLLRTSIRGRPQELPPDEHKGEFADALTAVLDELRELRNAIRVNVQLLEPHSDPYVKEVARMLKEQSK